MKKTMVVVGLFNKFVDVDEKEIKDSKSSIDNFKRVFETKNSPLKKPIRLRGKQNSPLTNLDLFLVTFERLWRV